MSNKPGSRIDQVLSQIRSRVEGVSQTKAEAFPMRREEEETPPNRNHQNMSLMADKSTVFSRAVIINALKLNLFLFVRVEALRPSQKLFSHVGTEPSLPGYYQYFFGGKCILLEDTTRRLE